MNEFALKGSLRHSRHREGGAALGWSVARTSLLGLSLAIACQCALAQAMYRIRPVGTLNGWPPNVTAFNGADQATGDVGNPPHAFLWKHDGTPMVDLGPAEPDSLSTGWALNQSGLVTGVADDSTGEFSFM